MYLMYNLDRNYVHETHYAYNGTITNISNI